MPLTRGAGAKLAEERGPHDGTALRRCLSYDNLGSKLINMIAFTNLQQFSETIGNCDKSVCLHAKIQQV